MPKEYDAIKSTVKKENPKMDDKSVSAKAAKIFYSIYGLTVKEAMFLEQNGKWQSYLKTHAKKKKDEEKGIKTYFQPSDFEIKEKSDGVYVSGFVSAPIKDSHGDYVPQEPVVAKLLDPTNILSKNLSYGHGWIKGDKTDVDPLGVLQRAELREHPTLHVPAAWAEYKLMKTHPRFEDAIYNIKEHSFKGFSLEIKDVIRKTVRFGNTLVEKLEDYFLGGVAVLGRPSQQQAILTGYAVKEYYYNGGNNMEIKEENVESGEEPKKEEPISEPKPEDKPESNTDSGNAVKKEDIEVLKNELDKLKKERDEEKQKKETEILKKQIDELKADKRVLVEPGEQNAQNFVNQNPIQSEDEIQKETIKKIQQDSSLSTEEKLAKIAEIDLNK